MSTQIGHASRQVERPGGRAVASQFRARLTLFPAVVILLLGLSALASAQRAITGLEMLAWEQDALDLARARSYRYALVVDKGAPEELAGVTCTGTVTPFTCRAPLPPLPPWMHTLSMTVTDLVGGTPRTSRPSTPVEVFVRIQPIRPPKPAANDR